MKKLILPIMLAFIVSCENEPTTTMSQVQTKSEIIDPQTGEPFECPILDDKEEVIGFVVISLECKKYTGDTSMDWVGWGMGSDGLIYSVKSEWRIEVDPNTNKPRYKQVISATVIGLPFSAPC